jgi:hypothetical protein
MSYSPNTQSVLESLDSLYVIDTSPASVPASPAHPSSDPPKPNDLLLSLYKSNGRYFEDPNPLIKCFNCNQYGHMSGTCPNPSYKFRCTYCGQVGHNSYTCAQVICHRCSGVGHKVNECGADVSFKCSECKRCGHMGQNCVAREETVASKALANVTCLVCREIGHITCFQPRSFGKSDYCSNCGERGHLNEECKKRRRVH